MKQSGDRAGQQGLSSETSRSTDRRMPSSEGRAWQVAGAENFILLTLLAWAHPALKRGSGVSPNFTASASHGGKPGIQSQLVKCRRIVRQVSSGRSINDLLADYP